MSRIAGAIVHFGALDTLSASGTPLHRLDPRAKVVTTLAFAAAVASFGKYAVLPLLPFALFPVALASAGGVPFGLLGRRLLLALPFVVLVGALNPVLDRMPVSLGPFAVAGGWMSFTSILLRFVLTVSAALVLVAVTGFHEVCAALGRLGVPRPLVTQLLVLHRYLFVLLEEAGRMERARSLRTFGGRGRGLPASGAFLGTLLLRTWGRAELIHFSMLARGFDGVLRFERPLRFGAAAVLFTSGWIALFLAFRLVDVPRLLGSFLAAAAP